MDRQTQFWNPHMETCRHTKISTQSSKLVVSCRSLYASPDAYSGRELGTRIKEHQGNINKREANSQIYTLNFDWNNVKVLGRSSKKDSRLFLESSFTYVNVNSINRCVDMPDQYKLTISNILKNSKFILIFFFLKFRCLLNYAF